MLNAYSGYRYVSCITANCTDANPTNTSCVAANCIHANPSNTSCVAAEWMMGSAQYHENSYTKVLYLWTDTAGGGWSGGGDGEVEHE